MNQADEDGFTLLELAFAMVLLSIGVAALIGVLATAFRTTAVDVHRTDATAIAGQGLTELAADPTTGTLPPVTRNGVTYTLTGNVTDVTASDGVGTYPELAVTVGWADAAGKHTLTQSTAMYKPPPTTGSGCMPLANVNPTATAPTGDPSVDVTWEEPNNGGPAAVLRWQVLVSPDGTTWTTAIDDEQPLAVGATHQVEIGGLASGVAYQVEVIAVTPCGESGPYTASAPATPALSAAPCEPSSMTLGPATAERVRSGASAGSLTSDVTVVVTSPGACALMFAYADTGHGLVSTTLTQTGTYTYSGTLPGLTQVWALGVHPVQVWAGSPSNQTALLCVEEEGAGTC